jgi:hypothetical protein
VWVWASCSPLDTSVLRQRSFHSQLWPTRPPGGVVDRSTPALSMLIRGKVALAVMLLALSSVALSSVAVTTATDDSSEGKRLMTMWANACMYRDVCYHMRPWGFGCVQKWTLWVRLC